MSKNRRARRKGFTLIEILLVLVILVILTTMASMAVQGARKKARIDAARGQIGLIESAMEVYQMHVNSYPSMSDGLEALFQPSSEIPGWTGPYLNKQVPLDPWNNPYQYHLISADEYRIWSFGPDGIDGSADDISSD